MSRPELDVLREQLHFQNKSYIYPTVASIRTELRSRRKYIIGSYISVMPLVCEKGSINDSYVDEISHFITSRTTPLWHNKEQDVEEFCYRFYTLAFYALASKKVGNESIDDVIQLAECLVRSRDTFITVLKNLLPANMISELFNFTEDYDDSYFTPTFEDAVLGGIAVFLGSLTDPTSP